MGFEIVGLHPDKEIGKSFSNNVWAWRPLWGYIAETCGDVLTVEEIKQGAWNNGFEFSKAKANKLAKRLYKLINSGRVDEWADRYVDALKRLPDEACPQCRSMASETVEKQQKGCWRCGGTGRVNASARAYQFSKENVRSFADFAQASGGFQVW